MISMHTWVVLLLTGASLFSPLFAQQTETGVASYYADTLHGRPTASGVVYDMTKMTAAHKALAFGTKVKVTRADKDVWVIVEINDRGPFVENRIIDLSRAAAEQLDMMTEGEVMVRIQATQ